MSPIPHTWVELALALAQAARRETLPRQHGALAVVDKGVDTFDPVTQADRAAERAMRSLLAARVPDHGVLGEEDGLERAGASHRWVLDPIDGTRAYITGFPTWVTLIALLRDGAPVLGVIDAPAAGRTFVGAVVPTDREPAFALVIDGAGTRDIRVRPCPDPSLAAIATTSPDLFVTPEHARGWALARESTRLARYGGDGLAYGLLAAGTLDAVVETGLQIYDLAAPLAVVRAAGGIATDLHGGDPLQSGTVIAAGDRAVYDRLRSCFSAQG